MIQRILSSKNFVACLLPAATGMALFFKLPFPAENVFLQLMALQVPLVHEGLFYSYNLFLFTTPYIVYSIVLSGLYVFGLTVHKKIRAGKLPLYPDPRKREDLFVVVGEVHNKRKPITKDDEPILRAISANQNEIGHSPSVHWHAAMTWKKSFAELQTIVPKISTILKATPASPSQRRKPRSCVRERALTRSPASDTSQEHFLNRPGSP